MNLPLQVAAIDRSERHLKLSPARDGVAPSSLVCDLICGLLPPPANTICNQVCNKSPAGSFPM